MVSVSKSMCVSCALLGVAMTAHTGRTAASSFSIQVAGKYCDQAVNPLTTAPQPGGKGGP
jgi:hypothetical protein